MARRTLLSVCLLVAWLLGGARAYGVEADTTTRLYHLSEVVISAPSKDIIPPQKLEGAVLKRLSSLSVADAIRFFSGVQIKDYGGVGGIKTINIRSMGTHQTGVYYNGIQLGNAQNGQIDLGKFSLENIDEIALYNGQKSDIFQSAREFGSAGNIYINSRRPQFENGKKFNLRAGVKGGSFSLVNPSALMEYKVNDKLNLSLNVEGLYADGRYKFRYRRVTSAGDVAYDTTAVRENGDVRALRAEAGLNHYYSNTGFWKFNLYHYNAQRGIPGAIVNNVWKSGERLWDRNSFFQASCQDVFFSRWQWRAQAKYAHDYTHYVNHDYRLLSVDHIYIQQEAYASLANKIEVFKWWDVSLSYDFQWSGMREYITADRFSHWLSAATAFNFFDRLRIQASMLSTYIDEQNTQTSITQNGETPDKFKLTPGIFLSYRPLKKIDLTLNAFYKHAYRYPTFNDLYYTDMGNAFLRPELSVQHDVGFVYRMEREKGVFHRFEIKGDYYYNKVKDKIIAYPKGQQFRWTMLNLGLVKINGVDAASQITLRFPFSWNLSGKIQYTYQTAIDITDKNDAYYGHQIPYIPWHSGSVVGMLSWKDYGINYSFIYVGERYHQQENIIYNYTQPWYTHDLSVSGCWKIKKIRLKATAEINNLLSQDYEVILNYPMPKRNYRIGLVVEY